jgi:predicted RecB family nuclease
VVDVAAGIGPIADQTVGTVPGIGSVFSARLEEGGIRSVQDLARAQPAELGRLLGTGQERAQALIDEARKLLDQQ